LFELLGEGIDIIHAGIIQHIFLDGSGPDQQQKFRFQRGSDKNINKVRADGLCELPRKKQQKANDRLKVREHPEADVGHG